MKGVLEDLKPHTGGLLALGGLPKAVGVTHVLTLKLDLDGPAVEIGVEFKHYQRQTQADCDQEAGHKQVHHQ